MTDSQSVLLQVVQTIVEFLKEEKLDGVVLELWRQFGGQVKLPNNTDIKSSSILGGLVGYFVEVFVFKFLNSTDS